MGPRDERHTPQDDLFRSELANLIDPRHPLVKLADRIDWSVFEREWSELFASSTRRPAAPPRLIAGLLYLQHAYNLSVSSGIQISPVEVRTKSWTTWEVVHVFV